MYRHATITRKLQLRLDAVGAGNYDDYLVYLKSRPDELDKLIRALTIKVSNFFRNPLVYELLGSFVLPELASGFGFLKIWSLGCAHGEEPYSVAIIIHELLRKERGEIDVRIVGTDIDSGAIARATEGEYSENELLEVKKKYMDTCFRPVEKKRLSSEQEQFFRVNNEIKSMVRLECADIIKKLQVRKSQLNSYNVILCRNVLIYMDRDLQQEIVNNMSELLFENGYLVIGESETMPSVCRNNFVQVFPGVKIFKKVTPRETLKASAVGL